MKFKVKLKAFFDYEVEVEAVNESGATEVASDSLVDYLENTLSNSRKFDHFHEYELHTEVVEVLPLDGDASLLTQGPENTSQSFGLNLIKHGFIAIGSVICLLVFVGAWTVLKMIFSWIAF